MRRREGGTWEVGRESETEMGRKRENEEGGGGREGGGREGGGDDSFIF